MRTEPAGRYQNLPCSYVGAGCAWEALYNTPFAQPLPDGLRKNGYLPLKAMDAYLRRLFPIRKKIYFKRTQRPALREFLAKNKSLAIICVYGHCLFANKKDYVSFFDNDDDDVVCVWYIQQETE